MTTDQANDDKMRGLSNQSIMRKEKTQRTIRPNSKEKAKERKKMDGGEDSISMLEQQRPSNVRWQFSLPPPLLHTSRACNKEFRFRTCSVAIHNRF
jgi:hypothetical protein